MKERIMQIIIVLSLALTLTLSFKLSVSAFNNTNKAWSIEYFTNWWHYDGTAQFVPSYIIPSNAGYSLTSGNQVKQAYVNYTRKDKGEDISIVGGRQYTRMATSRTSNSYYSVTATARDSLNIFTNQTQFWYGWIYF